MEIANNLSRNLLVKSLSLFFIPGCSETPTEQSSKKAGVDLVGSKVDNIAKATQSPSAPSLKQEPETVANLQPSAIFKDGAKGCDLIQVSNDTGLLDSSGKLFPNGSYVGVYHCVPPNLNPDSFEGPFILNMGNKTIEPLFLNCPKPGDVVYQPKKDNQEDTVTKVVEGVVFDVSSTNSGPGDSGSPLTTIPITPDQQFIKLSHLKGVLTGKSVNTPQSQTRSSCRPFFDPNVYIK